MKEFSKTVNLGKVLEKDLTRVLGSVLRGQNPLSDVILPNIFGVNLNDELGIPSSASGNGNRPVARSVITNSRAQPNVVFSNNSNVFSSQFQQSTSFVDDVLAFGQTIFNPSTSRSPGAPRRLRSGNSSSLQTSPSDNKSRTLQSLTNRIEQLTAQINVEWGPAGAPAFMLTERDELVQRRTLEFGVK